MVEQLVKICRSKSGVIRGHRTPSDGTTREQSPKSCLAGLSYTWRSRSGDGEVLLIPGQWTMWSTRLRNHHEERAFDQHTGSRQKLQEGAFGRRARSVTPRHPESMRPAATPPEGPGVAAAETPCCRRRDPAARLSFLSHGLHRGLCQLCHTQHSTPGAWTLTRATALSPPLTPAYHHQSSTCLHTSAINLPKRVAVVLTQARTTALGISFSFILLSSSFASTTQSQSLLSTTYIRPFVSR